MTEIADRGVADCKLLKFLSEALDFGYLVRLRTQLSRLVHSRRVYLAREERLALT